MLKIRDERRKRAAVRALFCAIVTDPICLLSIVEIDQLAMGIDDGNCELPVARRLGSLGKH